MARTRRPRMSWFRFYVDDFAGGIVALTATDVGAYVLLMMAQWASKGAQCVPADDETLATICKGVMPSSRVLSKFKEVPGGLRNQRLADEWAAAAEEFSGKKGSRKGDVTADVTSSDTAAEVSTIQEPGSKNQEPGSKNHETEVPPSPQGGEALSTSRPAARKKRKEDPVHHQSPDVIHAYNDAFGARLMYSNGNLRAASRALDAGYTLEQMREVFLAVRSRSTPTARWCCDNNRALDYLVRPPYKNRAGELTLGPLDKIPNELADRERGPMLSEKTRRTADMLAEFLAEPDSQEEP